MSKKDDKADDQNTVDEQIAALDEALGVESTPDEDESYPPIDEELNVDDEQDKTEGDKSNGEPENVGEVEDADEGDAEPETAAKPDEDEAAEKTEEPSDAEKALAEGSKKPSDEFGELDKDAPEKTRERFNSLKERFDEVSAETEKLRQQNSEWVETIQSTKTTPEQFGRTLQYLEAVNSADPVKLEQAYQMMMEEAQALGKMLGKEAPGYDPLSEYEDLKKKVDDGYLDREDALEIAKGRAGQRVHHASQQTQQQREQVATTQQQAMGELSALGAELRAQDPEFVAKQGELQGFIKDMVDSGVAPSEWAKMTRAFYKRIPSPSAAPAPQRKPAPNSLRPGGASESSSGLKKEPGSALEALDMALENMGQ